MPINRSLLIWDINKDFPEGYNKIVAWKNFSKDFSNPIVSITQLVEDNSDYYRSKYLSLIYELGELRVDEKKVVEHHKIKSGFSYWWNTLLVEKCNVIKSPEIDHVIKLFALEELLISNKYTTIYVASPNIELSKSIKLLADKFNITFNFNKQENNVKHSNSLTYFYNIMPHTMQATIWLIYNLILRWPLKGVGVKNWKESKATTTFVSYFVNFDEGLLGQGLYGSKYWTSLLDVLKKNKIRSNWLHLYIVSDLFPTAKSAKNTINIFNKSHSEDQNHVILDSFINLRVIWVTIQNWYRITKLRKLLESAFKKKCDYTWPLLEGDYKKSLTGAELMRNLLNCSLFDRAMSIINAQKQGFYLLENQGWEFGFVHAWKTYSYKDSLIGLPHSTVRFWDLRYYFDARLYDFSHKENMPIPSLIGVNGPVAKKMYLDGGWDKNRLVELEALRYLHLNNADSFRKVNAKGYKKNTLLILGDIDKSNTKRQMELLINALHYIDEKVDYILKPHPLCPILPDDYQGINYKVTKSPISELVDKCFLAYTSCLTSSSVDVYCYGIPVVSCLNLNSFNQSPLRQFKGVLFTNSDQELAKHIVKSLDVQKYNLNIQTDNYFYLNNSLQKWKKILKK